MGILLLLGTLITSSAVVGLGVWAMLRVEPRLGAPEDSVLSHWVGQREGRQDARPAAPRPL